MSGLPLLLLAWLFWQLAQTAPKPFSFHILRAHTMAFKRALSPTFPAKVTVNVPNSTGGFDKNTFEAVFRRPVPVKDDNGKVTETDLDVYKRETEPDDKQFLRDWMVGWTLKDEDTKQDVPFDPVELEALLSIEPTPSATVTAFYMAYRGVKAKN